ncbi:hypothetical protein MIDIC_80012 [Alphaproteobacteria bacterium]
MQLVTYNPVLDPKMLSTIKQSGGIETLKGSGKEEYPSKEQVVLTLAPDSKAIVEKEGKFPRFNPYNKLFCGMYPDEVYLLYSENKGLYPCSQEIGMRQKRDKIPESVDQAVSGSAPAKKGGR